MLFLLFKACRVNAYMTKIIMTVMGEAKETIVEGVYDIDSKHKSLTTSMNHVREKPLTIAASRVCLTKQMLMTMMSVLQFYIKYGPDYELTVTKGNRKNCNSQDKLDALRWTIYGK